jgi:hypothetical protein
LLNLALSILPTRVYAIKVYGRSTFGAAQDLGRPARFPEEVFLPIFQMLGFVQVWCQACQDTHAVQNLSRGSEWCVVGGLWTLERLQSCDRCVDERF